jgi:hypothetical protein
LTPSPSRSYQTDAFARPTPSLYNTAFGTIVASRGYARRVQVGLKAIW